VAHGKEPKVGFVEKLCRKWFGLKQTLDFLKAAPHRALWLINIRFNPIPSYVRPKGLAKGMWSHVPFPSFAHL
jgi:hypothetical protein